LGDLDYDGFVADDDATLLGVFYVGQGEPGASNGQATNPALSSPTNKEESSREFALARIDRRSFVDPDLLTLLANSIFDETGGRRLPWRPTNGL
jgi:hypothetical protein